MSEYQEYNMDTNPYPSFGKKYNGEKAIISLTSWRARINTVSKTLFSLLQQCPGFHIVLVLSEEEFPKMMDELPENLKVFAENELIEILWVYKNYKSFKKVLFTMDKYRDVPVISADDDCIYTCNYAQMFYDKWVSLKKKPVSIRWAMYNERMQQPSGASHFYFGLSNHFNSIFNLLTDKVIASSDDDKFLYYFLKKIKYNCSYLTKSQNKKPFIFHDEISALHNFKNSSNYKACY